MSKDNPIDSLRDTLEELQWQIAKGGECASCGKYMNLYEINSHTEY